jgi:predicted NAD/FAD-binding protein
MKEIDYSTLVVDGIDTKDYPDFCDAYFSEGEYEDGTQIEDEVLEELTANAYLLSEYISRSL